MQLSFNNKLTQPIAFFILGAIGVLGFAPFYFYPASMLSVTGLFYYWHKCNNAKQAAFSGFFYGLGLFVSGIYWIFISLHDFGNMPALMAALATFLLCAFLSLFPATVGALSLRISLPNNSRILAIAVLWALFEWIRSWIFTGFPWLTIGYTQVPFSPLSGYMPIIGVYGVSFITLFIASTISFWLAKKPASYLWKRNSIILLSLIWITGSALKQIEWTSPKSKPISVALIQGNIEQSIKWAPEVAEKTLAQYLAMAEASSAQLIFMPETALPVLSSELPTEIKTRLQQHAIKNKGDIVVGLVERENGEYFNSMLSILSFNSATPTTYRKSHLVPFGEFIPLKAALGWIYRDWLNMPLSDLSRGAKYQQPMPIAGEKVAINICYEDVFGEEIIRQLPAATLLVNTSNDAWYGESLAAYQHLQFSQARALETGRMMLRTTNTGATAMIDIHGKVIAQAPHFTKTTLEVTAQGYTGSTPYVRYGNWPFIMFCLGSILLIWRRNHVSTTAR